MEKEDVCVPNLTPEFIERMYSLIELYERPYNPLEPVVCLDEKSKQLLDHKRSPISLSPHHGVREDSEYIQKGTRNLFVAVEPKGKKRVIKVTKRRTKQDFANVVKELIETEYTEVTRIHLVVDNLKLIFQVLFTKHLSRVKRRKSLKKLNFATRPSMEVG